MSKTDKTKPYDVRVREEGGIPWRDLDWHNLPIEEQTRPHWVPQHLLKGPAVWTGEGGPARRRFAKRLRNKRIRKAEVPNLRRSYDCW